MAAEQVIEHRRESDKEMFERISQTEIDIAEMKANQGAIIKNLSQLSYDVRAMANKLGDHKTPWAVIISAMGLLLAIITALGVGFVGNPMKEMKVAMMDTHNILVEHVRDGHPTTVREIFGMRMDIIEREHERMLNIVEKQAGWIFAHNANDADIHAQQSTEINHLQETIKRLEDTDSQRASHEERLRSVERQVYPVTSYRDGRPGG